MIHTKNTAKQKIYISFKNNFKNLKKIKTPWHNFQKKLKKINSLSPVQNRICWHFGVIQTNY
jgi:hypothetical protein